MTTWGRSSRWSLDLPQVRNPASRPSPAAASPPSGTWFPCSSRATGASASSGHEVSRGGVEEQQVDLEAEHLARPGRRPLLQGPADLQQPVHRPVARVVGRRRQPGDQYVLARPAGAASFDDGASARFATRANSTRSADGSRRRPFSSSRIAGPMPSRSHSAPSTRAAQRPGLRELQALRRDRPGLPWLQVTGDGGDQPLEGLPGTGLLPAEVVDDLHPRPLRGRVPHVVGQLQVADLAAVLVPARRRPQVHILEITPLNHLSPALIAPLHVSMNLASQQYRPAAWPAHSPRNAD